MWRRIWALDAEIQGLMVTVRGRKSFTIIELRPHWFMSIDLAMMEIWGERFDCMRCSAPRYWWTERRAFKPLSQLSLPMKYGSLMVEKKTPSGAFCCTSMDWFDYKSFFSFAPQWCFMAHHHPRSNGNWVPPKSSPPVAKTEVLCRMERSAFTATGTFISVLLSYTVYAYL